MSAVPLSPPPGGQGPVFGSARRWRLNAVAAFRSAARACERGPLRPLVLSRPVVECRRRMAALVLQVCEEDVLAALDLLQREHIQVWVAGGWAVDALAGRRLRRHSDLDLVLGSQDQAEVAARLLAGAGFVQRADLHVSTRALPNRVLLTEESGRTVDLHVVELQSSPFVGALTTGLIGGRVVPCLSAQAQLYLKALHAPRRKDLKDIRVLQQEVLRG
jgi:lincosamide nucleotidyltransferase A/C/D/E